MEPSLRILLLEDNPNDAEMVTLMLVNNGIPCTMTRIESGEAFKAALEGDRFDLILADYKLPSFSGLDALKVAVAVRPEIPFIFVSGTIGEEFAVLTLHMGATDYVLKSNLVRLPAAVRRAVEEAAATAMQKRLEDSQRLHATRMQSLMDSSLDAIIVMDNQGVVLDWNGQAESMFGWYKADALGRTVAELIIPPQHREAHVRGLGKFLATGVGPMLNRRLELTALHRALGEFPVELTITAYRMKDQWQFTGFINDISRRKLAERRLAAHLSVTQVLAATTTLEEAAARILEVFCKSLGWDMGGIWRMDREAKVLRCLECWHGQAVEAAEFLADTCQRTFTPGEGMPGRVWSRAEPEWIPDVLHAQGFLRARTAVRAGLHAAVGFPIKTGGTVYGVIEFYSRRVLEPDTELMAMVGDLGLKIGQFVERKEAEASLQERELARVASERANQAKSEFLSRMSHELRTPLNAVLGFAQLLEMEELKPEQIEHVRQIISGGRHLLTLINEVLDIARIEAGRLTISVEPVPVLPMLGEAVDLIRPQAAARHIQLVLPPTQDPPVCVRADRQRLKQVLLNLLSNAVKYNREGGTLTVSCEAAPDGRHRVSVADTGAGIPAEMMARLFTPFDRLGADSQTEGTGLGLALTRSLIMAMGGNIFVNSVVGQGTTVSVELPVAEPPAAQAAAKEVSAPVPAATPAPGEALTVLYIEDNPANFELVEHLVERRPGVRLLGAMQGKLGVELATSHRPNLILLDLNLPDIQGDEVLLRLRERPETAGIPVVMLSADATPKQIEKLLASGAQRYLTKPIDVGQFFALLDEFTGRQGGPQT